jgi:oligopeptide/dipeptide ABC transporter ATP-binding protein
MSSRSEDDVATPRAGPPSGAPVEDLRRTSARADGRPADGAPPLVLVEHLVKYFPVRSRGPRQQRHAVVHAVDDVSFQLSRGETLGLVGESGSGKSTVARCVTRLQDLTSGRVIFDGDDISTLTRRQLQPYRPRMQLVFQDPYGSLNPRRRVGSTIAAPLVVQRVAEGAALRQRVDQLMALVGLNPEDFNRLPAQFSGGQRQRIGVARALALNPEFVVCDEPVSALDISIRAQIVNLLADLQAELGLTYLFISHDLSVVRHVSDRIAVMYMGKIVELAPTDELFDRPRHPYTSALLQAAPVPDPSARRTRPVPAPGDIPSAIDPPSGCRFRTRCPRARALCAEELPALVARMGDGVSHMSACHFPLADGEQA